MTHPITTFMCSPWSWLLRLLLLRRHFQSLSPVQLLNTSSWLFNGHLRSLNDVSVCLSQMSLQYVYWPVVIRPPPPPLLCQSIFLWPPTSILTAELLARCCPPRRDPNSQSFPHNPKTQSIADNSINSLWSPAPPTPLNNNLNYNEPSMLLFNGWIVVANNCSRQQFAISTSKRPQETATSAFVISPSVYYLSLSSVHYSINKIKSAN